MLQVPENPREIYQGVLKDHPIPVEKTISTLKRWLDGYQKDVKPNLKIGVEIIDLILTALSEESRNQLSAIVHVMESHRYPVPVLYRFLLDLIGGRPIKHAGGDHVNYQCGANLLPLAHIAIDQAWNGRDYLHSNNVSAGETCWVLEEIQSRVRDFPDVLLADATESGYFFNNEAIGIGGGCKLWVARYLQELLQNPMMSDADIIKLGIKVPDSVDNSKASQVSDFVNDHVFPSTISCYDEGVFDETKIGDVRTMIPLTVVCRFAIEQGLLIAAEDRPHTLDQFSSWIKVLVQDRSQLSQYSEIDAFLIALARVDHSLLPSLDCPLANYPTVGHLLQTHAPEIYQVMH